MYYILATVKTGGTTRRLVSEERRARWPGSLGQRGDPVDRSRYYGANSLSVEITSANRSLLCHDAGAVQSAGEMSN